MPPNGPRVIRQLEREARWQPGREYHLHFRVQLSLEVEISSVDGPSGGIQVGVTWSNDVSTTTVPLLLSAGDRGNQGTFTRYQYCTVGNSLPNCDSNIKISNPPNDICISIVQQPQQGQTPSGRLSDVAQTVQWQVDPTTYGGSTTFDVTVTWQVDMAFSQAMLWWGNFLDRRNHTDAVPSAPAIASAAVVLCLLTKTSIRTALHSACRFLRKSARAGDRGTLGQPVDLLP